MNVFDGMRNDGCPTVIGSDNVHVQTNSKQHVMIESAKRTFTENGAVGSKRHSQCFAKQTQKTVEMS